MYESVTKYEGKAQVTGEAEYTDDIEPGKNELFAAFVLSTKGNCDFDADNVDVTTAMVHKLALTAFPGEQ